MSDALLETATNESMRETAEEGFTAQAHAAAIDAWLTQLRAQLQPMQSRTEESFQTLTQQLAKADRIVSTRRMDSASRDWMAHYWDPHTR